MVLVMGGCSVTPEPEGTTPAFATEEEAFAAAEQTYRAYVDALNQVDLSDPETFEPVFALTTGEANAGLRESLSRMHGDAWTVAGNSVATVISPSSYSDGRVELAVCLDVSDVMVVDKDGTSVVDADRVDVQSMLVSILYGAGADTGARIDSFDGREGEPSCAAESP